MKKIILFFACVAGMVAFASCAKENIAVVNPGQDLVIPMQTVEFTTDITRTSLGDGGVQSWSEGDSVKILWKHHLEATEFLEERDTVLSSIGYVNAETGVITVSLGVTDGLYYAVYPPFSTSTIRFGNNSEKDTLEVGLRWASNIDGTWGTSQYIAAASSFEESSFKFKNVSNALKLTVSSSDVNKVVIARNDNNAISGRHIITFNDDADRTFKTFGVSDSNTSKKTTLPIDGPGTYYVPVLSEQTWDGGCNIVMYNDSEVKGLVINNKIETIQRNKVYNFGTLEDHLYEGQDVFVKVGGTGDGSSWDNATDLEGAKFYLSTSLGRMMVQGHSVRFAAGTYDFYDTEYSNGIYTFTQTDRLTTSIVGGYSASASGTDLSSYNPSSNITVFTNEANPTASKARILYCNGCKMNLEIKGIKFVPKEAASYRGVCMYINASCQGDVLYEDCTLDGANVGTYGAFGQFAAMNVTMNRCKFTNNTMTATDGTSGGIVLCSNYNTTTFNDCEFVGNTSKMSGVAICVCAGGTAKINRCLFENNTFNRASAKIATATNRRGGAVALYYTSSSYNDKTNVPGPKAYIDACEFKENKSTYFTGFDIFVFAAVADQHPELYINRSYFHDGNSGHEKEKDIYGGKSIEAYGAGKTANSNSIIGIYNCTFASSTASDSNLSGIAWRNCAFTFANSTIIDNGVATFRNDFGSAANEQPTMACNLINSVFLQAKKANSINSHTQILPENMICGYNIVGPTKNGYAFCDWDETLKKWVARDPAVAKPNPATDGYVEYSNMNMVKDADNGIYTFAITAGKEADADRPVQYATEQQVADLVAAACPSLDTWLKTIHADPYSIDKNGNPRNPAKVQKGSWDPYLSE